jgi:predicted O-methyltransferase YrrM
MALTTTLKRTINSLGRRFNLRIDSWTAIDREQARIAALRRRGSLDRPIYPLTGGMARFEPSIIAESYREFGADLNRLLDPAKNSVGYSPTNDYFPACDASVLYLMVRRMNPSRIVEVGCGNSTRISRQAIRDGALLSKITAVDPEPRVDIENMIDRFERKIVEEVDDAVFEDLSSGDFLFIDSSHKAHVGNDVAYLFCKIIPKLKPGVIVHVHDIFLPYDYPPAFAHDYADWGEQYVLHALAFGRDCDVLWPGHHIQRDRPDLHRELPFLSWSTAQSFWFVWK